MYNLLGQHMDKCLNWLKEMPAISHIHLYGKKESRENRKMAMLLLLKILKKIEIYSKKIFLRIRRI